MSFVRRVTIKGLTIKYRVRSLDIWEELICIERSQLRYSMSNWEETLMWAQNRLKG